MDSFNSRKRTSPEDFLPSNFDNKKHHLPDDKDQIFSSEEEERSDANKVITIRLVSEPSDLLDSNPLNFPPEFTNQIFGEEEQIFGYEDLQIKINFMASQFYANIDINYSKKEDNADDLYELFDKFFRGGYFKDKTEFSQLFPQEKNFKPYGKIIKKFEINQTNYEIFYCDFSIDDFAKYNTRLQVFLLFFINGASFIEEDHNWRIYLLYKKERETYILMGFTTVYTFYQDLDTCRYRISQFIIFPPYQRKGFGMHLISVVYDDALNDKRCFEITVEDSSIDFQFMRDCKDFELLMNEKCFDWVSKCKEKFTIKAYEEGNKELSKILIKTLRKKYKLTKNQIKRVIEIMKFTNFHENQQAFEFFKEEVKERLKLANKSEFYPFVNKKLPYIAFDGLQALINPTIYKNFNEAEVQAKLEEYFEEIISQYIEIKPKILKLISVRNQEK